MLYLIRHGETEWSLSGAHTGRTDLPLTKAGEEKAKRIREKLGGRPFSLVLTSPLTRARRTCEIAGYLDAAQVDPNLLEWNYGDYEGRTTAQIREERPDWQLFRDGVPNGETIEGVAARAETVIVRALAAGGDVALFAHGHILRILAARWMILPPEDARLFALSTASVSTLGFEHETRVISSWNL
ncbi:MAG: histidine phosphatase family protein [Acidobacteriota bacterium]|nr:histidine phosphatase family protein [Acidobacteriota bacterium]